jgi:hypothetical protein
MQLTALALLLAVALPAVAQPPALQPQPPGSFRVNPYTGAAYLPSQIQATSRPTASPHPAIAVNYQPPAPPVAPAYPGYYPPVWTNTMPAQGYLYGAAAVTNANA